MLDILIKNSTYPDYVHNTFLTGDIAIENGKITKINPNICEDAKEVIDATGKIVSPGFIDIHMHEENFKEEGNNYIISSMMLKMGVTTCLGGNCGVMFQSISDFKNIIKENGGSPVNYIMLAGYNALRNQAGVGRYDNVLEEQKIEIQKNLKKNVEDGAFGISFGFEYDPGITKDEALESLKDFSDKNLIVSAHYRSDGKTAINAISEMIDICEKSNQKFIISHLSSCSATGQMDDALALINQKMEENPNLTYDTYPYTAFSTYIGSAVFDEGCFEGWNKSYDCILITDGPYKNQFCTKELFEKLKKESPDMLVVAFVMNEEEITKSIANPKGMVASDGIISFGKGHPRAAGTFPRLLGKYVREEKALSLIDALRKITYLPADTLGLKSKGQIEEGFDGDITIFDEKTIIDGATFENLNINPIGIDTVIIGGNVAVSCGKIISNKEGKFIQRNN